MATIRMTEAELARDLHDVLAKVRQGDEVVVVAQDQREVRLQAQSQRGRAIEEILEEARRRNSTVMLDDNFGNDLDDIIRSHTTQWNPPPWD